MHALQETREPGNPLPGRAPALKKTLLTALLLVGLSSTTAMAHIIPVHFGTYDGTVTTPVAKNNGASGNFGWIDGADADWGDTHKIGTFDFTLTVPADVTLKFEKKTNAFGGTGLIPGFTLYQGTPHAGSDHDYSVGSELLRSIDCAATPGCTTTEGSLRSLTSFRITEDADPTGVNASVFTYVGHAYDGPSQTLGGSLIAGADGNADGIVTLLFSNLAPGNYIAFVGGANYASQTNTTARGIGGTITVAPAAVPIPAAVWLFASALAGLGIFGKRKSA